MLHSYNVIIPIVARRDVSCPLSPVHYSAVAGDCFSCVDSFCNVSIAANRYPPDAEIASGIRCYSYCHLLERRWGNRCRSIMTHVDPLSTCWRIRPVASQATGALCHRVFASCNRLSKRPQQRQTLLLLQHIVASSKVLDTTANSRCVSCDGVPAMGSRVPCCHSRDGCLCLLEQVRRFFSSGTPASRNGV